MEENPLKMRPWILEWIAPMADNVRLALSGRIELIFQLGAKFGNL